jgi:transcription elongation factor Elf1
MPKKSKVQTPNWILEGYDSKEEYEKAKGIKTKKKIGKTYKIRKCPKCKNEQVSVLLGRDEGKGEWGCKKCGWTGTNVIEEELNEDEFMEYLK